MGHAGGPGLIVLLGFGGLGIGVGVTATIRQLTAAASPRHAPDMRGLVTTTGPLAGVVGIAAFGTVYFSLAPRPGSAAAAMHAFAVVVTGFTIAAFLAAAAAYRARHHHHSSTQQGTTP